MFSLLFKALPIQSDGTGIAGRKRPSVFIFCLLWQPHPEYSRFGFPLKLLLKHNKTGHVSFVAPHLVWYLWALRCSAAFARVLVSRFFLFHCDADF